MQSFGHGRGETLAIRRATEWQVIDLSDLGLLGETWFYPVTTVADESGTTLSRSIQFGSSNAAVDDDQPDGPETTATVPVGGSVAAEINPSGDHDWFRVTLEAHQSYTFDMEGASGGVGDARLQIYDPTGTTVLAVNDNGGVGFDAKLIWAPEVSATYFIDASGLVSVSGTYTLSLSETTFESEGSWTPAGHGTERWYIGDFNRDRHDDIFRYVPGVSGADMFLSTGAGFNSAGSWTPAGHDADEWYVGDFNADGRSDLFRYHGAFSAEILLSNGSSFLPPGPNVGPPDRGPEPWYLGDFNGDGRTDIFRYMPGQSGAEVMLTEMRDAVPVFHFPPVDWTPAGHGDEPWYVGDFNGDGKDDIFRYVPGTSGADMFLSDGTRFVPDGSWTGAGHDDHRWYVGDFNGDGMDDIMRYIAGVSGGDVFLSTGTAFRYAASWTGAGAGADGWYVGDFNHDIAGDEIMRYLPGISGAEVFNIA